MSEDAIKKMCGNKKRYPSLISVFVAIGRIRVYFKNLPEPRHYPCPICGGFHITTQPKSKHQIQQEIEVKKFILKTSIIMKNPSFETIWFVGWYIGFFVFILLICLFAVTWKVKIQS